MTSLDPRVHPSLRNAAETYLHLALGVPGACLLIWDGAWAVHGTFDHAICNLAVSAGWRIDQARRAAELAVTHRRMQVYELQASADSARVLRACHWTLSYELDCLERSPLNGEVKMLKEATTDADRAMVARFMANQFFASQPQAIGATVAEATAKYARYRLFWASVGLGEGPDAAVMLHEAEGRVGLYNLCLVPDQRGRGLGKLIMGEALAIAQMPVSLQCEGRLVSWYESIGFAKVAKLQAYVPNDRAAR